MEKNGVLRIDFVSPLLGLSFLMLFFVWAFIYYRYQSYTKNILFANINNRIQIGNNRDESSNNRKAGYWLNAFFLFVVSLLLYIFIDTFFKSAFKLKDFTKLIICLGAVILGQTIKLSFKQLLGIVFKKEELTSLYATKLSTKDKAFGILMFPLLILYTFSLPLKGVVLLAILVLSTIYLVFRWVSGVIIGIKQGNIPIFYSILYICTLEILPVALAIKVFSTLTLSSAA